MVIKIFDALTSKIALIALLLIVVKFLSKRIGSKKIDARLMKIHRPASNILLIAGLIHTATSFVYIQDVSFLSYLIGFICMASIICAVVTFVKKDRFKHWLAIHRIASLVAIITLFVHAKL